MHMIVVSEVSSWFQRGPLGCRGVLNGVWLDGGYGMTILVFC